MTVQEALDAKPGEFRRINGKLKVCLVGVKKIGPDDYATVLGWYEPKGKDARRYERTMTQ